MSHFFNGFFVGIVVGGFAGLALVICDEVKHPDKAVDRINEYKIKYPDIYDKEKSVHTTDDKKSYSDLTHEFLKMVNN